MPTSVPKHKYLSWSARNRTRLCWLSVKNVPSTWRPRSLQTRLHLHPLQRAVARPVRRHRPALDRVRHLVQPLRASAVPGFAPRLRCHFRSAPRLIRVGSLSSVARIQGADNDTWVRRGMDWERRSNDPVTERMPCLDSQRAIAAIQSRMRTT